VKKEIGTKEIGTKERLQLFLPTEKKPVNNMIIRMSIQNHSSACIEEKRHIQIDQEMKAVF
jgi:hypothetical protein